MGPRLLVVALCVIAGVVGLTTAPLSPPDPWCERFKQYQGSGSGGGPGLNFDRWVACSDSVVTGVMRAVTVGPTVVATLFGRRGTYRTAYGTLTVERSFKGRAAPGTAITVEFVQPPEGVQSSTPWPYQVYFLSRHGLHYEYLSALARSSVAAREVRPSFTRGLDGAASAVAAVLTAPGTTRGERMSAIGMLRGSTSPAAAQGLRLVLEDPDQEVRRAAVGALLETNDIAALSTAERELSGPPPTEAPSTLQGGPSHGPLDAIRSALAHGFHDPRGVTTLLRLLESGSAETRRAAVRALSATESRAAIPGLVRMLDDPDPDVRHFAVVGLATLTRQRDKRTTRALFSADSEFITYWKDWARTEGLLPQ